MPNIVAGSQPPKRRRWLAPAVFVLLLVVFAGVAYIQIRPKPSSDPGPVTVTVPEAPRMNGSVLERAIDQLYNKQDYQGAVDLAERNAVESDTLSMIVLAGAYARHQDYDKAFVIYDRLDAANLMNGSETMTAAQNAQLGNQKARAIEYYHKAQVKLQAQPQDFATARQLTFISQQLAILAQ